MEKWFFVENGTRPGEKIIAKYHPDGTIHTVAAAFISPRGYIYKIYPVRYKTNYTIKKATTISIHDVDLRGFKR